jgi:hypothetical protein
MTMELSELETIDKIIQHWEKVEHCTFNEDQRQECIDVILKINQPLAWWHTTLVEVKPDVKERYLRVVGMLKDKGLIDQAAHDYEVNVVDQFSPAELTRRGKDFADWYRAT